MPRAYMIGQHVEASTQLRLPPAQRSQRAPPPAT